MLEARRGKTRVHLPFLLLNQCLAPSGKISDRHGSRDGMKHIRRNRTSLRKIFVKTELMPCALLLSQKPLPLGGSV